MVKFTSDFIFLMSKETYQEIKRISGEELRELLSDLDNVFDLGTGTLMGDSYLTPSDYQVSIYCCYVFEFVIGFFPSTFK